MFRVFRITSFSQLKFEKKQNSRFINCDHYMKKNSKTTSNAISNSSTIVKNENFVIFSNNVTYEWKKNQT